MTEHTELFIPHEEMEQYRDAVRESPLNEALYEESWTEGVPFGKYIDNYILDKLENEAPFFMQEYTYGNEPNQKVEVRYGPHLAEVAMLDRNGNVRFLNRVGIDVLLPSRDDVEIVTCLVLAQSLNYLLDLQDEEHDAARVCEEIPQGD